MVKNLTDYGAFIDLGGIDGLLHVTDMCYGRVTHPSEMLQVGEEITVKVLKFDRDKERISLGLKQIAPDPWETVTERYLIGMRVIGRVVSVTDYGAFVEIEDRRRRSDPHHRDDLVAPHEASVQGGQARAIRWSASCSR